MIDTNYDSHGITTGESEAETSGDEGGVSYNKSRNLTNIGFSGKVATKKKLLYPPSITTIKQTKKHQKIQSINIGLPLKSQVDIEENMDLEESKNPEEVQRITIGGYNMTIRELTTNIVENNSKVGIQVDFKQIEDDLLSYFHKDFSKESEEDEYYKGYTNEECLYYRYLYHINNIPMIPQRNELEIQPISTESVDPLYTLRGTEVEKYIDEFTTIIEDETKRLQDEEEERQLKKRKKPEEGEEPGGVTKRGGAIKLKKLSKKEYISNVKPWLNKLPISPESGELFRIFLEKTRELLNIRTKELSSGHTEIVTLLKNMMNIITRKNKIVNKLPEPSLPDDTENVDTEKSIYECFLNDEDGDPQLCKIIADMLSIFTCFVLFCITNNEPEREFSVEMRTLFSEKIGRIEDSIKKYTGKGILFEGCTKDNSDYLYWNNYFQTPKDAQNFVESGGQFQQFQDNQVTKDLLKSSNGNNKFSSPLSGGLLALCCLNMDMNTQLKLVCYESQNPDMNDSIKREEMVRCGSAARTCIDVRVNDIYSVITSISDIEIPDKGILQTIVGSTSRYEFLDLLLKYSITPEMILQQINNLRGLFGEDFIANVMNLRNKIMSFFTDNGMCVLEDSGNGYTYAKFINSNTFDNPDNRSVNYRYIYNKLYIQLYNLNNEEDLSNLTLTYNDLDIITTTYIISTPLTSGGSNFQHNWSSSFNRLITGCYCREYTNVTSNETTAENTMNVKVSIFNNTHSQFINEIRGSLGESNELYTVTYSDKTQTYGGVLNGVPIGFQTWLDNTSIDCSFDNFLTYTHDGPQDFCGSITLREFLFVCFSKDIYHDSKPSSIRVNQTNSDKIRIFVNNALNFYYGKEHNYDYIKYEIILKAKLPDSEIVPHIGRTYEQQCYARIIPDKKYNDITNGGLPNANVDQELTESIFKYNNAVFKKMNVENTGNSSTFIDGGTSKQTENILIPNLCLCIHGNENGNENGDKFYIIVSYECREIVDGTKNIIMRINLIYIPKSGEVLFVVHEFVLGKGVHCKEVYNDLASSAPINTRFKEPKFNEKSPLSAFPILFSLKKTCCDLFQNILKCSSHVKNGDSYEILGFFKKMDKRLLDATTNKDIAYSILMESDFKELLLSQTVYDNNITIIKPSENIFGYSNGEVPITTIDFGQPLDTSFVPVNVPAVNPSTELSNSTNVNPQIPNYIYLVNLLSKNDADADSLLMANVRWYLLNNPINAVTYEILFLNCLYTRQIYGAYSILGTYPLEILTKQDILELFTYIINSTTIDIGTKTEFNMCIQEIESGDSNYLTNRFTIFYRNLFYRLSEFATYSQLLSCSDLLDISNEMDKLNQRVIRDYKNEYTSAGDCRISQVSLFTYNNILWEIFRPSGKKNMLRNINTIPYPYDNTIIPSQIAITGDILDSLFSLLLVSLTIKRNTPGQMELPYTNEVQTVINEQDSQPPIDESQSGYYLDSQGTDIYSQSQESDFYGGVYTKNKNKYKISKPKTKRNKILKRISKKKRLISKTKTKKNKMKSKSSKNKM